MRRRGPRLAEEVRKLMRRVHELVDAVKSYAPGCDEALIERAYVFAMKAHSEQRRANGDPYFSHPVEVAGILSELRLDETCIAAGLLHDTVEDTPTTKEDIERLFGADVAKLVEGVTKLAKVKVSGVRPDQAANLRKLLFAMSDDLRVLLVKLADRLHNMRTLGYIAKPEKRARIARETLDIHAPLADRLGLGQWRAELEDRAFAELYPDMRKTLLERLQRRGADEIHAVLAEISACLAEDSIEAEATGRTKSPYSIWRKMEIRGVGLDDMADLVALRLIVSDESSCYAALGALHRRWRAVPGRFKDYVSVPKANGYRSIHTVLVGPGGKPIEVQIRTKLMHELAEHGVAAHWAYKDPAARAAEDALSPDWARRIAEDAREAEAEADLLRDVRLEMYQDKVFCFAPDGAVVELPRGATMLDFAYAIHSELGRRCRGAKRNGEDVPLATKLETGDAVVISVDPKGEPDADWESLVATGRAKAAIKRQARSRRKAALRDLGGRLLDRACGKDPLDAAELSKAALDFGCGDGDELMERIGEGLVDPAAAAEAARPRGAGRRLVDALLVWRRRRAALRLPERLDGVAFRPAACCSPISGDPIVGVRTAGLGGVQVHAATCPELLRAKTRPDDWVDLAWTRGGVLTQSAHLLATVRNRPGALGSLCAKVGAHGCNITDLFFSARTADSVEVVAAVTPEGDSPLGELVPRLLAGDDVVSARFIDDAKARSLLIARRGGALGKEGGRRDAAGTTADDLLSGAAAPEEGRW